jgi:hypothetical protein
MSAADHQSLRRHDEAGAAFRRRHPLPWWVRCCRDCGLAFFVAALVMWAVMTFVTGCGHLKPAGGEAAAALASADTHNTEAYALTKDAKANTESIKPYANEIGKQLVDIVVRQLETVLKSIAGEKVDNAALRQAVAEKDTALADAQGKYQTLYDSTGAKLERWVRWAWFWIKVWLAATAIATVAGLLIPGPIGMVLSIVGRVLWVPGWFHTLADNAHFRGWIPWVQPKTAVTAPPPEPDPATTALHAAMADTLNEMRRVLIGVHISTAPVVPATGIDGAGEAGTTLPGGAA